MISILFQLTIIYQIFVSISTREVCYEDYGCFTTNEPFGGTSSRPLALLPEHPDNINTKFNIYRRGMTGEKQFISVESFNLIFNNSLPTKIIVHGFFNHPDLNSWMGLMKDELLKAEDSNVIITNWASGSFKLYTIATANTQVVGIEVARLISMLVKRTGVEADSFHCIGHSLGAHVCGYAGKRIKLIGRITGMDPAGPYFENTPSVVRLDKTDAKFVDIIHTNARKLVDLGDVSVNIGIVMPIGHVDFYVNGGENQPGCSVSDGNVSPACSHTSATKAFINSIKNQCRLTSYECESYDKFSQGDCLKCGKLGCNQMGYFASPQQDKGSLFLNTNPVKSEFFCKNYYQVVLQSNNLGSKKAKGYFKIYFKTSKEISSEESLDDTETIFESNSVHKRLVSLQAPLKDPKIVSTVLNYKRGWNPIDYFYYESQWIFKKIEIISAQTQIKMTFCPTNEPSDYESIIKYTIC